VSNGLQAFSKFYSPVSNFIRQGTRSRVFKRRRSIRNNINWNETMLAQFAGGYGSSLAVCEVWDDNSQIDIAIFVGLAPGIGPEQVHPRTVTQPSFDPLCHLQNLAH
jgi:hypothetical protein